MPEVLPEGLPQRATGSRYDFTPWADGQAWKFERGEDYDSTTQTFRHNVRRWAKAHGFTVHTRPVPATDERGRPLPSNKVEPIGLAVCFSRRTDAVDDGAAKTARAGSLG